MHMSRKFFGYHVTRSTNSGIIFGSIHISGIYTQFWKELEKFNFFRVNKFAKSVNFEIPRESKNWNYQTLNTNPYVGELTLV